MLKVLWNQFREAPLLLRVHLAEIQLFKNLKSEGAQNLNS